MSSHRALLLSLVVVACLAGPGLGVAVAACDTFSNPNGGEWGTSSNWSNGVAPTLTDPVCIALAPDKVVTVDGLNSDSTHTVASITVTSGTLEIAGVAGISSSNETTNQTALTVTGGVTVAHGAALYLAATGGGTPTPGGAAGGGALLTAGSLVNDGTFQSSVDDPAWSNTLHASSFTNAADGNFFVEGGTLSVSQGTPFSWTATNAGLLDVGPTSALNLTTSFAGSGAFTDTGVVENAGSITSSSASGSASWSQAFGGTDGNPIVIGARSTLIDSAGSGFFTLADGSTITGTISGGQTVTMSGAHVSLGNTTVVNAAKLVLDASAGSVNVTNGSLQNMGSGTITAQIAAPSQVLFQAGLANAGALNITGGTFDQNGGATTNAGTVALAPTGVFELEQGSTFTNLAAGTIVSQLAGPTSFGQFQTSSACCAGAGSIAAGGALMPQPVGGYVPAAGAVFPLFALSGPFGGTFASVAAGYTADYTHATASPSYVGVVYGAAPAPVTPITHGTPDGAPIPEPRATAVKGGKGLVTLKLSCPGIAGGAGVQCAVVSVKATVVERFRRKTLLSLVAKPAKKQKGITLKTVVIASGTAKIGFGSSKAVTFKVNAAGRALLAHHARLASLVIVTGRGKVLATSTLSVLPPAKKR